MTSTGLILGLHTTNERRRYKVTPSLAGWAQTWNQPCVNQYGCRYLWNLVTLRLLGKCVWTYSYYERPSVCLAWRGWYVIWNFCKRTLKVTCDNIFMSWKITESREIQTKLMENILRFWTYIYQYETCGNICNIIYIQQSVVITRSNLSRYFIRNCDNNVRKWIRF